MNSRRFAVAFLLLAVASLAWFVRATQHRKVRVGDASHWVTTDPDSLHQLRRIEGVFQGGLPPAEFDAELSWPEGSAIPAPPYYPIVAWSLLAPFAPADAELRRTWLEESACTLPALFGVLAAIVVTLSALELVGLAGAAFVGVCFAVAPGAVHYACVGNGDYQSWSLLLAVLQLGGLTSVLRRGVLERSSAWRSGLALGALQGLAIGSWTPALIVLVLVDGVLALGLRVHTGKRRLAGLPGFGLALHLGALAVLAPALASSPWRTSDPWQVVNLSWFHATYLSAGALVFAPLLLKSKRFARPSYVWIVATTLGAAALVALVFDVGPGAALREAFSWAGAENTFMAQVAESAPLVGAGAWSKLVLYLGYSALLAPLFAFAWVWRAWRAGRLEWAPWCAALLVFGPLAALQMRFAEFVVAPIALAVAVLCSELRTPAWLAKWPQPLLALVAALGALGTYFEGVRSTLERAIDAPPFTDSLAKRSARGMSNWLRANSKPGAAVMASWSYGQLIQWAAERPVVASNYGHYTGEQAFLDSFRFFGAQDSAQAEALLQRRDVRYVLVTSDLERQWPTIVAALGLADDAQQRDHSVCARLLGYGEPLEFVRIVRASIMPDPKRAPPGVKSPWPSGFVYERVAGAWIEAHGHAGARLDITLPLKAGEHAFRYSKSAVADANGVARVRIPYATERVGEVAPTGPLVVRFEGASSSLKVQREAVRNGLTVVLP